MLTAERRRTILERLEHDGKVVAAELVELLDVSEDTVRRDLRELSAQGLLHRVHGGALPSPPPLGGFAERLALAPERKAALAEAALPLLEGAGVIILDGGTTAAELARRLPRERACTVLTNAPPVAIALAAHPRAEVVLLGGRLLKREQVTVGAATVDALRRVRADVAVLGVCSLHPEAGLTQLDREESLVERAMIASSARVATLTGADKLGFAGPWPVARTDEIDVLVTDAAPEVTAPYSALGLEVVRAQ
jgi:DeoR/GlpR family transcriptional regulator of sugar metabolism